MSEEEYAPAGTGGKHGETNRDKAEFSDLKKPHDEDLHRKTVKVTTRRFIRTDGSIHNYRLIRSATLNRIERLDGRKIWQTGTGTWPIIKERVKTSTAVGNSLRARADRVKGSLAFEKVLEHYGVPIAKTGSSYWMIECPNIGHEDEHATNCAIWPGIGVFRCFVCNAKGDVIELVRLLEESRRGAL